MVNITNQVFSEVYDIILHMDEELLNKIPNMFIELMKQNRDEKFQVNIDYSKSLIGQEIQRGTKVILSLIYRDYLCSVEKRLDLIKKDEEELKQIEEELKKKYNPDNLFKAKLKKVEEFDNTQTNIIIYKETVFQKILKKFKQWFHLEI